MENNSSIAYKTFASQFADHSSLDKQGSSFERKSLAIKKGIPLFMLIDKLLLLHSLGL
jgi:hypothetical protein